MRISRFRNISLILLISFLVATGTSCSFYTRVMTQKNLVDGAAAYNQRKFDEAVERFQRAVSYDPELTTVEANTAQLFLARTLHSLFAGNRKDTDKAKQAIEEYKKALPGFIRETNAKKAELDEKPDDEKLKKAYETNRDIVANTVSNIGSLYDNLQQDDKWKEWQTNAAKNAELPSIVRANSYTALAQKQYSCANEITEAPAVKKTVVEDGSPVFKFSKPEDEADFDKLKKCVAEGMEYANEATKMNPESDSAWSYKASLLLQQTRIAEMEGNSGDKEKFKKESDEAKAKFEELAEKKRKAEEEAARKKAEEIGGEAKEGENSENKE